MEANDVEALKADVFTETLARRFEEGRLANVPANDREARQSALVSISAYMPRGRPIVGIFANASDARCRGSGMLGRPT